MSDPAPASRDGWQLGPHAEPGWWNFARQVIMFCLGVAVICYSVATTGHDVAFLITGLILLGIIPIERVLTDLHVRYSHRRDPDE